MQIKFMVPCLLFVSYYLWTKFCSFLINKLIVFCNILKFDDNRGFVTSWIRLNGHEFVVATHWLIRLILLNRNNEVTRSRFQSGVSSTLLKQASPTPFPRSRGACRTIPDFHHRISNIFNLAELLLGSQHAPTDPSHARIIRKNNYRVWFTRSVTKPARSSDCEVTRSIIHVRAKNSRLHTRYII